jgi:AcrR family transcriptional regulator
MPPSETDVKRAGRGRSPGPSRRSPVRRARARRTQGERRAATRARLLAAAGRVFAERGYHAATLDEIAETAGLSKGAVYYNFESKERLFLALLEERLTERLAGAGGRTAAGASEPETGAGEGAGSEAGKEAGKAARDFLEGVERDPRWPPLFFEFVAHCARDPKLRADFGSTFFETGRELLADMIRQRAGDSAAGFPVSPEELAVAISALVNGMAIERMFHRDAVPDDLLGRIVALLIGAVTGAVSHR